MVDLLIAYLLSVLAVYRVARMIALEDGPGNVFQDLRGALLRAPAWVQTGISCPLCLGFWLSWFAACILLMASVFNWPWLFGMWLAIAGGQTALVVALRDFGGKHAN